MCIALLCCLSGGTTVYAMNFDFGDDVTLAWEVTTRYSSGMRLLDQDDELVADINRDDGNRNFNKNSLFKNRFDLFTEADFNTAGFGIFHSMGIFARAHGWYDIVYNKGNDNDSPLTTNNLSVAHDEFTDEAEEWNGKKAEMLDYFIYAGFDIAGHRTNVRIGQQALNWGETLFLPGGVMSSQGPLDATGFNQPGAELKELFLPVEQVAVQMDLTELLNIEAYYQWEWQPWRLDEAGSYYSTFDALGEGGESYILGPWAPGPPPAPPALFRRNSDEEARDSGQWGMSLHYLAENFYGTEFGLYYINYHDQLPQFVVEPATGTYHWKYIEDVRLMAASFGTVIASTNVAGEVAYRIDTPVSATQVAKIIHGSLTAMHFVRPTPLWTRMTITAEVAANEVLSGVDSSELALLGKDKFAWGYAITFNPGWMNILPKLDIWLPLSISQGVNGNSSLGGSFTESKDKWGITAKFIYKNTYTMDIGYTNFFGGPQRNLQDDRDNININMKYSF